MTAQQPKRVKLTPEGIRHSAEFDPENLRGWAYLKVIGAPPLPPGCAYVGWDSIAKTRTVALASLREVA
jgi:hypothetical protein